MFVKLKSFGEKSCILIKVCLCIAKCNSSICSGPNFIIIDLPSVLILVNADPI